MRSDWWKFNECMMSGTRSPVRYIRRGKEAVRTSDLGPSENQARSYSSKSYNCRVMEKMASLLIEWSYDYPKTYASLVLLTKKKQI